MVFHGVNVVVKVKPFMPTTDEFDSMMSQNDDDINLFKKWGFNFVRLGVMWEGYETEQGKYDQSYLEKLNIQINKLGKNGIYSLIDLHQDAMSRVTCGEGVPTFYTRDASDKCSDFTFGLVGYWLGLCKPMSTLIENYDVNVNTPLEKCVKNNFGQYGQTPGVQEVAEKLYTEGTIVHQAFLNYWDGVSKYFKDNQYVVGYDLINEPSAGNLFKNPLTLLNPDKQLQKLYQNASDVIRKNDANKIIFFSASQMDIIPVLKGYIRSTKFTETPSKGTYSKLETMVDHIYCDVILGNDWGKDEKKREQEEKTCYDFIFRKMKERNKNAQDLKTGLIYNEFGACSDTDTCATEITFVTEIAESHQMSWAYWMYKGYNDFTTANNSNNEGLFQETRHNLNPEIKFQENKVKALARSYIQTYQGEPKNAWFNKKNAHFVSQYDVNLNIDLPSVLFLSKEFHYPNGPIISLSFLPQVPVKTTIQDMKDNYYSIKCEKTSHDNFITEYSDTEDVYSSTLYVTKPFDESQIENLNKNYLNKLKISLTLVSTNKDVSLTSMSVKQSSDSPDYYLEVLGITDVEKNGVSYSYCKVSFQAGDSSHCDINSYKLTNNLIRIYERKKVLFWTENVLIFENTLDDVHGQVLSFEYSKDL